METIETTNEHQKKFRVWLFWISVFANGFFVLLIELVGARLITPYFGGTIFVWSAAISTTLGALAVGYWLGGKIADNINNPEYHFYLLLCGGGIPSLFMPLLGKNLVSLAKTLGYQWGPLAASVMLFFIPLVIFAAATTVGVKIIWEKKNKIGNATGTIFSVSTVGSITGALLTGYVLIPSFSLPAIIILFSSIMTILGMIGIYMLRSGKRATFYIILACTAIVAAMIFLGREEGEAVLFRKQGFYGEIVVADHVRFGRCLLIDNMIQGCRNIKTEKPSFPVFSDLLRPLDNTPHGMKVLFLGLGGGMGAALATGHGAKVTVIEIDPLVVYATKVYFGLSEETHGQIIVEDARHFLQHHTEKYDLIVIDLYQGVSSAGFLWTREMFAAIKKTLAPDGLIAMNVPGVLTEKHGFHTDVLATLGSVFPNISVFSRTPNQLGNIIIYASEDKKVEELGEQPLFATGKIMTDLKNHGEARYTETALKILKTSSTFSQNDAY